MLQQLVPIPSKKASVFGAAGSVSWLSPAYNWTARLICFRLFKHAVRWARAFALDKAGSNNAARMPMIAMTTSSSTSVNALLVFMRMVLGAAKATAHSYGRTSIEYQHCPDRKSVV